MCESEFSNTTISNVCIFRYILLLFYSDFDWLFSVLLIVVVVVVNRTSSFFSVHIRFSSPVCQFSFYAGLVNMYI